MSQNWRKLERNELRAPNGFFTNPTVLLFFIVIAIFYYSSYLFVVKELSGFTVVVVNAICLYAIYTVTHEAIHEIAHNNRFINFALGYIGAAHEGITFPLLKLIHPQHHLYTNHPEKDPDYVIGKKPRWAFQFFSFTTYLMLALSFVLMGKAVAALQEAAFIMHSPLPIDITFEWLGIHSTWEGILAQSLILILSMTLVICIIRLKKATA